MPRYKCFVPGCKTGNGHHFFRPPNDEARLKKWKSSIPRKDKELTSKNYVCELHFCPEFIVKCDKFLIKGETVELPRTRWKLTHDAFPHLFPGLPKYLSIKVAKRKDPAVRQMPVEPANSKINGLVLQNGPTARERKKAQSAKTSKKLTLSSCIPDEDYTRTFGITDTSQHKATQTDGKTVEEIKLGSEVCQLKHQLKQLKAKCAKLTKSKNKISDENLRLRKKGQFVRNWDSLSPKAQLIMEMFRRKETCKKNGMRYSTEFVLEAMLLCQKSPLAYKHCAISGLLPLPPTGTLKKLYAKHLTAVKDADPKNVVTDGESRDPEFGGEINLRNSCLDEEAVKAILDQIEVFSYCNPDQQ